MEPPAPQSQQPQQPDSSPEPAFSAGISPQPPRRPLWLKLVLLAILLILIAVAIFGAYSSKHKKSGTGSNSGDTSLYYDRAGYDRQKLASGVGDPMAIKLTAKDGAQTLRSGEVILPGCSILTIQDIQNQGLRLYPNGFGYPVQQNYLDKSGEAAFAPNPNNFPLSSDSIGCHYGIDNGSKAGSTNTNAVDSIDVSVNQSFTVTESEIDRQISALSYVKQADMGGYQTYKSTRNADQPSYMLRKDGTAITLDFDLTDPSKVEPLVKKAVDNLTNLQTKPKGVSTVSYDTPTFIQKSVKACDLVDNSDMKQLSGVDASPLVRSSWPTGTGVADFSQVSNYKTQTNYLRNSCERLSNYPEYKTLVGTKSHSLQVTTTTYENSQAALQGLLYISVGEGNDSKTQAPAMGNEAYLYRTPKDHQNALAFRQGRVVVELVYDFAFQENDPQLKDLSSYGQKLAPIGQKIAKNLQSFN